ncbi:hypothetical protein SLS56_009577 [Neofusicoccum ribis]|uniref:Uncharacterized protein n=1 Tax=Neofusicoccum ribis TaxID=45134 RepID=A0ABR3SGW0_9PEZI
MTSAYETKLKEVECKLALADQELGQCRQQERFDNKRTEDAIKERDFWKAKSEHLQNVVGKYASDIRRIRKLEEEMELADRGKVKKLAERVRWADKAEKGRTQPKVPEKRVGQAQHMAADGRTNKTQTVAATPRPLNAARSQQYSLSKRLAVIPLILVLSAITRFMQKSPVYPEILDRNKRPVFAAGSVLQMMLFNVVAITLLWDYARYKIRVHRSEGEEDVEAAQLGGPFSHWTFVASVCERAWKVLLVAAMAFALLILELHLVSV